MKTHLLGGHRLCQDARLGERRGAATSAPTRPLGKFTSTAWSTRDLIATRFQQLPASPPAHLVAMLVPFVAPRCLGASASAAVSPWNILSVLTRVTATHPIGLSVNVTSSGQPSLTSQAGIRRHCTFL